MEFTSKELNNVLISDYFKHTFFCSKISEKWTWEPSVKTLCSHYDTSVFHILPDSGTELIIDLWHKKIVSEMNDFFLYKKIF